MDMDMGMESIPTEGMISTGISTNNNGFPQAKCEDFSEPEFPFSDEFLSPELNENPNRMMQLVALRVNKN